MSGWVLVLAILGASTALARPFRIDQLPNGSVLGCGACHVSPAGGGPRNKFGVDVGAITGSANKAFWTAALAAKDSDGDTFTNGVELGDPEGDGTVIAGWKPTFPGNANSKPAVVNQPPQFTSTPVASAFQGELYQYTATATDPESTHLTFSKVAGPDWLSVEPAGLVQGTPPALASGDFSITIRVTDSGAPAKSADQSYTLTVQAGFAGWAATHFNLPAEAALSGPQVDADGDGLANLGEYAFRRNPRVADAPAVIHPAFRPNGEVALVVAVRDDDPRLLVQMEVAAEVAFTSPQVVNGTASDPTPGDGLKTLEFKDPLAASQLGQARFWRLKIALQP
jgi:hypothetical protein